MAVVQPTPSVPVPPPNPNSAAGSSGGLFLSESRLTLFPVRQRMQSARLPVTFPYRQTPFFGEDMKAIARKLFRIDIEATAATAVVFGLLAGSWVALAVTSDQVMSIVRCFGTVFSFWSGGSGSSGYGLNNAAFV